MRRDGHDRAGAVPHQHVVRDEDRNPLTVGRIGRVGAREDTRLVLGLGLPLDVGLRGGLLAVRADGVGGRRVAARPHVVRARGPGGRDDLLDQLVLGRQDHVRGAEQRVLTGREDSDGTGVADREVDARALAAPDPVALLLLDGIGPVQRVQVGQQPVGVRGDAHVPLAQLGLEDREVAALGASVGGDFLVRQNGAQTGTPVDGGLGGVRQSVLAQNAGALLLRQLAPAPAVRRRALAALEPRHQLADRAGPVGVRVVPGVEDLYEDPLGPAVELGVDGGDRAPLVVPQAQPAQLPRHVLHGGLGRLPGVGAAADRVLLGGQAEGVEAQRVQHVVPAHALVAGVDVGGDVAERVPHVQPGPGGVGEHVHDVLLGARDDGRVPGQVAGRVRRLVGALAVPEVLPACLDVGGHGSRVAVRRGRRGRLRAGGGRIRLAHVL